MRQDQTLRLSLVVKHWIVASDTLVQLQETGPILPLRCETCNKFHKSIYASGRFCNNICARGFSRRGTGRHSFKEFNCKSCGRISKGFTGNSALLFCSRPCHQAYNFTQRYNKWINGEPAVWARTGGVRVAVIKRDGYICRDCGISEWHEKPIALEVDHIDGNCRNNRADNLRLLCPNCHSQTPTFGSKNRGNKFGAAK